MTSAAIWFLVILGSAMAIKFTVGDAWALVFTLASVAFILFRPFIF